VTDIVADIKFCGMTRGEDVLAAAELGAAYVGCVFAGGPRRRTPSEAASLFAVLSGSRAPRRVGVFAPDTGPDTGPGKSASPGIEEAAARVPLDIVQVHGDASPAAIAGLRARLRETQPSREVWAVVRCEGGRLPSGVAALWAAADALLLDAHVPGLLGGTGTTLPWMAMAASVRAARRDAGPGARLILAGGLTPGNVAAAIAALQPDVVDVSSGVERAPGIKDHDRMRAFAEAVRTASVIASSPSSPLP
jgi:phosphoribosylanthranilate isomerase